MNNTIISCQEFPTIINIVKEASQAILEIYKKDFSEIEAKDKEDGSPLTLADQASHNIITQALAQHYTGIPIMSEENTEQVEYNTRKNWTKYWCVDPLDGTKEFIKKNDEFTINIALMENNRPVLGIVYAPALDTGYYASQGQGAYKIQNINSDTTVTKLEKIVSPEYTSKQKVRLICSRSHKGELLDNYINNLSQEYKEIEAVSKGSALKFGLLADNQADIYTRLVPCMEWDTAAGHIVLKELGMNIYNFETSTEIEYNKENLLNPYFIAY